MKISSLLKDKELLKTLKAKKDVKEINVSSRSESKLGQKLAPDWKVPFKHPVFGKFNSIQAYWTWITTKVKKDELREMHSAFLNRHQKDYGFHHLKYIRVLIAEALLFRVAIMPSIQNELKTGPDYLYRSWYEKDGMRRDMHYSAWYGDIIHDIQYAIKNDAEFDPTSYHFECKNIQEAYDEVMSYLDESELESLREEQEKEAAKSDETDEVSGNVFDEENSGDTGDYSEDDESDEVNGNVADEDADNQNGDDETTTDEVENIDDELRKAMSLSKEEIETK